MATTVIQPKTDQPSRRQHSTRAIIAQEVTDGIVALARTGRDSVAKLLGTGVINLARYAQQIR